MFCAHPSVRSGVWLLAALGGFAVVAPALAQFAEVENFGTTAIPAPGTPFDAANWSLVPGCSPGFMIAEGTRQYAAPNSLKVLRGGTGTRLIADLNPGAGSSDIGEFQWTGNDVIRRMFFSADTGTGTNGKELYRVYQVVYPTTLLELDINPGPAGSNPSELFRMSATGNMLFAADDGTNGVELWKSQTGANFFTVQNALVLDINSGPGSSNPSGFSLAGTLVVFSATDSVAGRELWKTDGVFGGAGTTILKDIRTTPTATDSSDPQLLTRVGTGATTLTYFTADDGVSGRELWRTDGTPDGTVQLKDIVAGPAGSNPTNLTAVTLLIGTVNTPTLLFTVDSDGANGMELWKSNGATDGSNTVMVKDVGGSPSNLYAAGNLLFFTIGNTLWKSDGTDVGTVAVQSFTSIAGPLVDSAGSVYFAADDGAGNGVELWKSDGTTTALVHDVRPGPAGSSPTNLFPLGSRVYFSADDGTNGREPWRTDATLGAVMIKDVNPGPASSNPAKFTNYPDGDGTLASLVFVADDGTHGAELWQTDGNATPTQVGIGYKWDLTAEMQSYEAGAGKVAVAGSDQNPWTFGAIIDGPTIGGGNNRIEARQAIHQLNFLVEATDGTDRAPLVITNVNCNDGSAFTRPKAALSGDGQPHKAIAAGLLAIMDQEPCDTSAMGPQSPNVPLMEVPVIYDGLNWIPMTMANFPNMQQLDGVNVSSYVASTALPPGLGPATRDPVGTKRFDTIRMDVLSSTIRVLFHKRQNQADDPESAWVVELPKHYSGAFKAVHIGTPGCVPSPYLFFVDPVATTGGIFTNSLDPFGACCAPSGCTDVASAAQCSNGSFSAWTSCSDPGYLCCPQPWADSDRDGDVDFDDYGAFQACYTGPNNGIPAGCECFNKVSDPAQGIDDADFQQFRNCVTGPAILFNMSSPPPGCTP